MKLVTQAKSLDLSARQTRAVGRTGRDRIGERPRHRRGASGVAFGGPRERHVSQRMVRAKCYCGRPAATTTTQLFTELVATRMLMVNLLKPLILGKQVSQDWITEAMAAVRREKRKAARDLMQQYTGRHGRRTVMATQWGRKETVIWPVHVPADELFGG